MKIIETLSDLYFYIRTDENYDAISFDALSDELMSIIKDKKVSSLETFEFPDWYLDTVEIGGVK